MKSESRWNWMIGLAMAFTVVAVAAVLAAPPAAPKVSTFAPTADLEAQVAAYLDRLDESVKSEEEYKDAEGKVGKDANTLVLIALALGMDDQDNKYKAAAPALIKASQDLAKTKDYAAAKAGVEAVKKAAESKDPGASALKWTKVASLPDLMKQVPLVNNRLKRNLRTEKAFKTKAKSNAGDSAVLAVIAQGSMADTSEAKNDAQIKQWYALCAQMRDEAATVNAAIHDGKLAAAEKAMKALNKTCDDCHDVFNPAAKEKNKAE